MLVIILTTIIVLITLWFCPIFDNSIEHYAPSKGGQPSKGAQPPKGAQPSLTPDTVISIPLGVLVQFLSKVGAGDVSS